MHVSVNTSTYTLLPYCLALVKPNVVFCNLGMRVRWCSRYDPGVT